jgi:hypothetical protein
MPGASGDEKVSGPPTSGGFANEPGFVPSASLEGLAAPRQGRIRSVIVVTFVRSSPKTPRREEPPNLPGSLSYAGANRIRFGGYFSATVGLFTVRSRPERREGT